MHDNQPQTVRCHARCLQAGLSDHLISPQVSGAARGALSCHQTFPSIQDGDVVVGELCESSPAVTRLTVYRRPQVMRLFVASACFKRDVLVICVSDRYEILREHTRRTKESFTRSS